MSDEKYRFVVEWFDPTVKLKREFLLSYFPSDGGIEMYDLVLKRVFLRRMRCETVDISSMFVGSMINVLSRQLYITGFGDKKTAEKFTRDLEATLAIINVSGFKNLGEIIDLLEKNKLTISRAKMIDREKRDFNESSFSQSLEKKFVVVELRGENAINTYNKILGNDSSIAKTPKTNLSELRHYCVGPSDEDTVNREIKIFFPLNKEVHCNSVVHHNSTCCIIKPHAFREAIAGKIMQDILNAGFQITALEVITFDLATASEFYEVYKGVVAEYKEMVAQLMSGPCIALEITSNNGSKTPQDFRTFVGPSDPEIARKLRPGTLRANYGHDKVKNAVHCTDLPDDAKLELDYLFRVLFA